jgi:NhaP-type Na+/H+ and K+/H+ antiporter
LASKLDCVEDVLRNHMYRHPICENIIRMNDSVMFEHETRLPNGDWLLIIYQYNFVSDLTVDKIFDEKELFNDVTEKYKNYPNVVDAMQLITEEINKIWEQ